MAEEFTGAEMAKNRSLDKESELEIALSQTLRNAVLQAVESYTLTYKGIADALNVSKEDIRVLMSKQWDVETAIRVSEALGILQKLDVTLGYVLPGSIETLHVTGHVKL